MEITIKGDAKEIAALLGTERLIDSKFADFKEKILGEITNAAAKDYCLSGKSFATGDIYAGQYKQTRRQAISDRKKSECPEQSS